MREHHSEIILEQLAAGVQLLAPRSQRERPEHQLSSFQIFFKGKCGITFNRFVKRCIVFHFFSDVIAFVLEMKAADC